MARASKVDPCMLCGCAPCECNKPVPKTRVPRKPKPVVDVELPDVVEPTPPPAPKKRTAFSAMKAKARPVAEVADNNSSHVSLGAPRGSDAVTAEKAVFDEAIRALAPILHSSERVRYASIINSEPTPAERRVAWQERRRLKDT